MLSVKTSHILDTGKRWQVSNRIFVLNTQTNEPESAWYIEHEFVFRWECYTCDTQLIDYGVRYELTSEWIYLCESPKCWSQLYKYLYMFFLNFRWVYALQAPGRKVKFNDLWSLRSIHHTDKSWRNRVFYCSKEPCFSKYYKWENLQKIKNMLLAIIGHWER